MKKLTFIVDLSRIKEFEYIPYPGEGRLGLEFLLADDIPWKETRILLHTKDDFPDAHQISNRISVGVSKTAKLAQFIDIGKTISLRETTRKVPCTLHEYMTCQNIEDNQLVLQKFICQIPTIYYGPHLDNLIRKDIPVCTDDDTRQGYLY